MDRLTFEEAYDVFYDEDNSEIMHKEFDYHRIDNAFAEMDYIIDDITDIYQDILDGEYKAKYTPEGFEVFEGYLDDPYQSPEVGKAVITDDGDKYYITDVDEFERQYFWVSSNPDDCETGRGHSMSKDRVAYISSDVVI